MQMVRGKAHLLTVIRTYNVSDRQLITFFIDQPYLIFFPLWMSVRSYLNMLRGSPPSRGRPPAFTDGTEDSLIVALPCASSSS